MKTIMVNIKAIDLICSSFKGVIWKILGVTILRIKAGYVFLHHRVKFPASYAHFGLF